MTQRTHFCSSSNEWPCHRSHCRITVIWTQFCTTCLTSIDEKSIESVPSIHQAQNLDHDWQTTQARQSIRSTKHNVHSTQTSAEATYKVPSHNPSDLSMNIVPIDLRTPHKLSHIHLALPPHLAYQTICTHQGIGLISIIPPVVSAITICRRNHVSADFVFPACKNTHLA